MDNFLTDIDTNDAESDLIIPEPSPNGDLRPSPIPMQFVPDTKEETTSFDAPQLSSEPLLSNREMDKIVDEDKIVKSINFHSIESDTPSKNKPADTKSTERRVHANPDATKDAKCFAIMGASGGTGVTSLCIQLAYDISKRTRKSSGFLQHIDPTVCLIDLDFETGSCASYLDVPHALEISDICGPAHRIDTSIVQALMSQHQSGIAVLSTPNALGANSLANPETVLALLDAAAQLYDHVILDLPRNWQPWIAAAISGADHFALVSELTIPSLLTTRTRIENIEKAIGNSQSCEVILNKVERRSFRNSIRLADAEKALQRSVSATICVDHDTTREAINCGEAVELIRAEARYVKDVRELSLKWEPNKKKKAGLFKDRRKKRRKA